MNIRKFQASDLDNTLQLFTEVVHTIGAKYYNSRQVNAWAPKGKLDKEKWLKSLLTNETYIAEDNEKIVGFGDMTQTGYIDHLYVHKDYQGSGVALAILRKLEKEACRLGLTELTTEASVMAMPIARRHGFEVIEKKCKLLRETEFVTYLMRKKI